MFTPLAQDHVGSLGLTDDAALIDVPSGQQLVTTTDSLVAGVHFLPDDPPQAVAARALRTNLSDLAAMGADPAVYTMAIAIPSDTQVQWLELFVAQLSRDQDEFGIVLIGGDTVRTPGPMCITITAMGYAPENQALRRNGAVPGDIVYVSGSIGDAALGLMILKNDVTLADPILAKYATDRFHFPSPRLTLGESLRGLATACADISDGLIRDLGNICRTSQCRAILSWEQVPLSAACVYALENDIIQPDSVLSGGDDYELVFTGPQGLESKAHGKITRIGVIESCAPDDSAVEIHHHGHVMEDSGCIGFEHSW